MPKPQQTSAQTESTQETDFAGNVEELQREWNKMCVVFHKRVTTAAKRLFDKCPELAGVAQLQELHELICSTDPMNYCGKFQVPVELDENILGYSPSNNIERNWKAFRKAFDSARRESELRHGELRSRISHLANVEGNRVEGLQSIKDECDMHLWDLEWIKLSGAGGPSIKDEWDAYSSTCNRLAKMTDPTVIDISKLSNEGFRADGVEFSWGKLLQVVETQISLLSAPSEPDDQTQQKVNSDKWPPDLGWHFRPGEAAFLGTVFEIRGRQFGVLKALAGQAGGLEVWSISKSISPEYELSPNSIKAYVSQVRSKLREVFLLDKSVDPLPNVDWGERTAWKLDSEGISRATEKQR